MQGFVLLLAAGFLLVTISGAAEDDAPHDRPAGVDLGKTTGILRGEGELYARPLVAPRTPAAWVLVADEVQALHLEAENLTYLCAFGEGAILHANGTYQRTGCTGIHRDDHTAIRFQPAEGPALTGALYADENRSVLVIEPTAPRPPAAWPGYALMTLAGILAATTALLAWQYARERRIARYLVRRLFEETKGAVPADWPPELRRQTIARFIARGKN